jgi:hypothetical protein
VSVASTSFNYTYASLDASRAASAAQQPRIDEATSEQLRNNLSAQLNTLSPGTTVTARYQYTVGADGTLVPTQTQITTQTNEADDAVTRDGTGKQSRQALSGQGDTRRQSFGDIAKPRAQLSPSDELALFSSLAAADDTDGGQPPVLGSSSSSSAVSTAGQVANAAPIPGEAVADDGSKVDVEIFTSSAQLAASSQNSAQVLDISARTQQSAVAALYARNNDLVYSTPQAQLAA